MKPEECTDKDCPNLASINKMYRLSICTVNGKPVMELETCSLEKKKESPARAKKTKKTLKTGNLWEE